MKKAETQTVLDRLRERLTQAEVHHAQAVERLNQCAHDVVEARKECSHAKTRVDGLRWAIRTVEVEG